MRIALALFALTISCSQAAPTKVNVHDQSAIESSNQSTQETQTSTDANSGDATAPASSSSTDNTASSTGSTTGASSNSTSSTLAWNKANLTNYESYPDPGSDECIKYNGCTWAGMFAAVDGKMTEEWVKEHNIISIHSKDFSKYKLKTLRLRQGSHTIDAKVYDECSDSDCDGCCTQNAKGTGFLIDIEKYTKARFGGDDGVVEWQCIDCN